ncbi:hypothetical protein DRH14_01135, partial [Candidatus Shapirobacteria bacterium]
GIPCHAFDIKKSGRQLIWKNTNPQIFTTLDGSQLQLHQGTLVIANPQENLSLSFLGGQKCAIDLNSNDIIVEMAIYKQSKVRKDSRQLKTITEASIRLDKFLDANLIPQAFAHLQHLISQHCQAQISSQLFEFSLPQPPIKKIKFHPSKVSQYAGIEIDSDFALDILKKIDCQIQKNSKSDQYLITPPSLRKDINIEEDLIEEIIRYYGYNNIPTDQPISSKKLNDITPPILYLIETITNILTNSGYDEIRSWPLITKDEYTPQPKLAVHTQNSINNQYTILRQSLITSAIKQAKQYSKYKLPSPQFFEVAKVFNLDKSKKFPYQEHYSLAIFNQDKTQLQSLLSHLSQQLGTTINNPQYYSDKYGHYLEINLEKIKITKIPHIKIDQPTTSKSAIELTSQIINLDANLELNQKTDPNKLLQKYAKLIGQPLWQIEITDIYHDTNKNVYRYTFRVYYYNIDEKQAKSLHLKVFNLS